MSTCAILNTITWTLLWFNFQLHMVSLALSDVHYATLAVGRGDIKQAHRLSRRAVKLRRFGYPLLKFMPQARRLFW